MTHPTGDNRHLNLFRPYSQDDHEDQLTRAAVAVMRCVPLARVAFCEILGVRSLSVADSPQLALQAARALEQEPESDPAELEVVSVFLTPDVLSDDPGSTTFPVAHADRGQRLDAVLRFPSTVVVIETKKVEGESDWQARAFDFGAARGASARGIRIAWHDVLEHWRRLADGGALGLAERLLIEDLFQVVEEHFPQALPFKTLRLAGAGPRRERRLETLLTTAVGEGEATRSAGRVDVRTEGRSRAFQRFGLLVDADRLSLRCWPGESVQQAQATYAPGRADQLVRLADSGNWAVRPSPHLGFRFAQPRDRLYLSETGPPIDLRTYVELFDGEGRAQYSRDALESELWPWLENVGLAGAADVPRLARFLETLGARDAYFRPGLEISRSWDFDEAVALDDGPQLQAEIAAAVSRVFELFGDVAVLKAEGWA